MGRKMRFPAFIFFAVVLSLGAAHADTYGLVVGINDYTHHPDLRGAVNDAKDIADALHQIGAKKVIRLLNGQATYDAIRKSWNSLVQTARDGDTIVFSYAGHGGREPERIPGTEDDHLDDSFVLGGFSEQGRGSRERIIDNEIHEWFSKCTNLSIIFVADSCYSGSMTRSIDFRSHALGFRSIGDYGEPVNDFHPPPSAHSSRITASGLPNVIFFSSSRENERTPEITIGQKPRGALSWAFAKALRGAANVDNNALLTKGELEHYLEENIRMVSEGRQHPNFIPRGGSSKPLFTAKQGVGQNFTLPTLNIKILPESTAHSTALSSLHGVQNTSSGATPDLVWDKKKKQVLNGLGDIVTNSCPTLKSLQQVVDKWRIVHLIQAMSERNGLVLRLSGGDKLYHLQDMTEFIVQGHKKPYFTLLALGPQGRITLLYPLRDDDINDAPTIPVGTPFMLDLEITRPFGAEHLVAFSSERELTALHQLVQNQAVRPEVLFKQLKPFFNNRARQTGILGIYSAR